MKNEFREAYTNLFENSFTNLRRSIQVKLKAIRYSNKYMARGINGQDMNFKHIGTILPENKSSMMFEPIEQIELEDASSDFDTSDSLEKEMSSISSDDDEFDGNGSDIKSSEKKKQPELTFKQLVFKNKKLPNRRDTMHKNCDHDHHHHGSQVEPPENIKRLFSMKTTFEKKEVTSEEA